MAENVAAFSPMPRANVTTAATVKRGFFTSIRRL